MFRVIFVNPILGFILMSSFKIQKHPFIGVLMKWWSKNMQQIYRRIIMPKWGFNKVTVQLYWNFTSAWVFSCKFAEYFRTPLPKNTSGGLLLKIYCSKLAIIHSEIPVQSFNFLLNVEVKLLKIIIKTPEWLTLGSVWYRYS